VRIANSDFRAKIFALAFGFDADMPLLLGIAIQNGGKAVLIYEGYGDSDVQMESFYKTELNNLLLQDLTINIASDVPIQSKTQTSFPVFADGNEISVRARPTSEDYFAGTIQVVANAISGNGPREWIYEADIVDSLSPLPYNRECIQSFAHTKIKEVIDFKEASAALGSELTSYADLIFGGDVDAVAGRASDLEDDAKQYALDLVLEAGLIWPGLTAMVSVENEQCAAIFAEGNPICDEGGGLGVQDEDGGDELEKAFDDLSQSHSAPQAEMAAPQSQPQPSGSNQKKGGVAGVGSSSNIGTISGGDVGTGGPMVMSSGGRSPAYSNAPNVLILVVAAIGTALLLWMS